MTAEQERGWNATFSILQVDWARNQSAYPRDIRRRYGEAQRFSITEDADEKSPGVDTSRSKCQAGERLVKPESIPIRRDWEPAGVQRPLERIERSEALLAV